MIYSKSSPVGIDVKIYSLQTKIHTAILAYGVSVSNTNLLTGNIDIYGMTYNLKEDLKITPVKYSSGELTKSLFTTDKTAIGYFYDRVSPVNVNGMVTCTIGNIWHINLSVFYPSITHRADSEIIKFLTDIFRIEPYGFRLDSFTTGISKVYADFNFNETIEDIPPYFSVRFDLNINFRI